MAIHSSALPLKNAVRIVEVGPRDGLQNISARVPTSVKIELISRLRQCQFQTIELTSIVSPRAIPQLADCRELLSHDSIKELMKHSAVDGSALRLPVLVPNIKGFELAERLGVKEVAVFVSATEGFSRANINCTVDEGLERARQVAQAAKSQGLAVRGYVSCIFADPYDGPTSPAAVLRVTRHLFESGCYEVSLGDTLGIGVAGQVRSLLRYLTASDIPISRLAGHFHDTYGQALSNLWEAYQCGIRVFDSSVAGLGGCPFAPGAKGNVASEDVVYMFEQAGVRTGVDIQQLIQTGAWISDRLGIANTSRAGTALLTKQKLQAQKQQQQQQQQQPPSSKQPAPSNTGQSKKSNKVTRLTWTLTSPDTKADLLIYRSGANVKLVLNRPQNGNALTTSMVTQLTDFFTSVSSSSAAQENSTEPIHRIALTATGNKFFCTGMDLSASGTSVGKSSSSSSSQFTLLTTLFEAIESCPLVTVAAVNGACYGGGCGLALACDIRLFSRHASLTLSEVRLGLAPATISRTLLRECPIGWVRELMLTGRRVTAAELKERGLCMLVTDVELQDALDGYLHALRHSAPGASEMVKSLVRIGWMEPGGPKQGQEIRDTFERMMRDDAEAAFGVKEFQRRKKSGAGAVDWDEIALLKRQKKREMKL